MKLNKFEKKLRGRKTLLAVLVDPDKYNAKLIKMADRLKVDCFLAGGSVLENGDTKKTVKKIKRLSKIPVILFPGDETQLSPEADGMFLPALLSGRNSEYLIGKHVKMAPAITKMKLKCLPVAYLLLSGGRKSSSEKVTGTRPINISDTKLIIDTCLAAQLLGFRAIYLEAGSGARNAVPSALIRRVKKIIRIPIIAGGGISTGKKAKVAAEAGANMIVIGNALEKNVHLLEEISAGIR